MTPVSSNWTLLVYKIPTQPTRLRLQVWRKLQRLGVLYLQDAVCLLPARPDLTENMQYIAEMISEMGGTYHLFSVQTLFPEGVESLVEGFRLLADQQFDSITGRLETLERSLAAREDFAALEKAEEELKRERVTYLRAKRVSYFGGTKDAVVEKRLDALRCALDDLSRND